MNLLLHSNRSCTADCPNQARYPVMASCGNSPTSGSLYYSRGVSSRQSTASPPLPVLSSSVPVSSQSLSFSISSLLGLEDNVTQTHFDSASDNSIIDQNQRNCIGKSRTSSERDHSNNVDSDNPSTDGDSGRESDADRSIPSSTERPRKRKQRTTFSPIEVCELEKVFAARPYLMPEDEDELVQKLGLTTRNIRFWFQNRRAKLRRKERSLASIPLISFPNQFDQYQPASHSHRELQFRYPAHAPFQRPPLFPNNADYLPSNQLLYGPDQSPCPCCPIRSNRLPAADVHSSPHRDYLKYLSNPFAEPPAFMGTVPRVYPSQLNTTPNQTTKGHVYKMR